MLVLPELLDTDQSQSRSALTCSINGLTPEQERKVDLFERAKAIADQATAKTKESVEEARLMIDLRRAYSELGKLTFKLVEDRELENQHVQPLVDRIRGLERDLETRRQASTSAASTDKKSPPAP